MLSSIAASNKVCDLNSIYNPAPGYSCSLPRGILESFLSGKAFDNPEAYTKEESAKLMADINDLYQYIMSSNPVMGNLAILSAGSPGAGKTTVLRQHREKNSTPGFRYAYVCPDDICLKGQTRTYVADIESSDGSFESRQAAYTKWRPGSNGATHLLLAHLIRDKYAFYFGTTCSSPMTYKFFEFLKNHGYQIKVLHISAPDEVCWGSVQERDKSFVQTTEEDIREKGLMVPQRIKDTFLSYADEIEFYYHSAVSSDAIHAATWMRNEASSSTTGQLTIHHRGAYECIKTIHDTAIEILGKPELKWEATIEAVSTIL